MEKMKPERPSATRRSRADKHMNDLLREIYGGKYEPLRAMIIRDVNELMEKIVIVATTPASWSCTPSSKFLTHHVDCLHGHLVALFFTYTNGFHDTANAIATVVGTKF